MLVRLYDSFLLHTLSWFKVHKLKTEPNKKLIHCFFFFLLLQDRRSYASKGFHLPKGWTVEEFPRRNSYHIDKVELSWLIWFAINQPSPISVRDITKRIAESEIIWLVLELRSFLSLKLLVRIVLCSFMLSEKQDTGSVPLFPLRDTWKIPGSVQISSLCL